MRTKPSFRARMSIVSVLVAARLLTLGQVAVPFALATSAAAQVPKVITSPGDKVPNHLDSAAMARLNAPPAVVSTWGPQHKVIAGMPITITGSFTPADVTVRLGLHRLAIVTATATTIVARAPSPDETGWTDENFSAGVSLSVQNGLSQGRTIENIYKVLDRWTDFHPHLFSVDQLRGGGSCTDTVCATFGFGEDVTIVGMPGDEVLGVVNGPVSGSPCSETVGSGAASQYVKQYQSSPDGATLGLQFLSFSFPPTPVACAIRLPLRVHYRDNPNDIRTVVVDLGTQAVQSPDANNVIVENSYDLYAAGVLQFLTGPEVSAHGTDLPAGEQVGICDGRGIPGGPQAGRLNFDGDLTFIIYSGPIGTTCSWALNPPRFNPGWSLVRMEFRAFGDSQCDLSQGQAHDARPLKFTFTRFIDFIGDKTITGGEFGPASNAKVIFLSCYPTVDIGHSVSSTLHRVVLHGPPGDTDWHHAFKP